MKKALVINDRLGSSDRYLPYKFLSSVRMGTRVNSHSRSTPPDSSLHLNLFLSRKMRVLRR